MIPTLFKLGPVTVHTYGFMMAVGVALGLWFVYVQAKKAGLEAGKVLDACFYTIIISLIGAKLVLFVGNARTYLSDSRELLGLVRSGGVFQGGLAAGIIFAVWYFRRKKIPFWRAADLVGPALALGHGFGRLGCFSAGCCYGSACSTPWAVTFKNSYAHELTGIPLNTALHPVQLYEAVLNFLNFGVLFLILRKKRWDGQVFSFYIVNYSVIRFFTEYFRGDHPDRSYFIKGASNLASLSYSQLFCIAGLIAGVALLFILRRRKSA